MGKKRLTYTFVKNQFEIDSYELLSDKYINCGIKLSYKCPEGHIHSISWANWQQGGRCVKCAIGRRAENKRLDINLIKSEFEREGYTLLTKKYTNNSQKLDYICPEGHKYNIRWSNWRQGARCFYCNITKRANKDRLDVDFIRSMFEKEKYHLLTTKYVNNDQKLDCICPEGHKHNTTWNRWKKGVRCRTCWRICISVNGNPSWKGGVSCDPYCDAWADKEYKESIKERDGYRCLNPDCWKKDGRAGELSIHHIDYDKQNCNPNNLITLCRSCNSRANTDREWHKVWYDAIIYKRYHFTGRLFK